MNRLVWIASLAFLLAGTTGCLHHNTRGGCSSGNCGTGSTGACSTCSSCSGGKHGGGLIGKLSGNGGCSTCGGRNGCVAGPLAWQQGGLNYSGHLGQNIGAHLAPGHYAAQTLQSQPFTPGPPTGTVAYPYYTHRGPRDFLLDNPPSIGR